MQGSTAQSKKIYVDCTFTYQSGFVTGIQRVVRNIIARHELVQNEFGLELQPVVSLLGQYYYISPDELLASRSTIVGFGQKVKNIVSTSRTLAIEKAKGSKLVAGMFDFIEFLMRQIFLFMKFIWLLSKSRKMRDRHAFFETGSTLVLLDAFWTYDIEASLEKSNGGVSKVISVIYDLIPVLHSEFVEEVNCKSFSRYLPKLIQFVDQFVCISESVAIELKQYLIDQKYDMKEITFFRLGSDFEIKKEMSGEISPDLRRAFQGEKPWLAIGTIEPRKNHKFILDTFDKIWAEGGSKKLVIVGRIGWMCDEVMARIKKHPNLNQNLFFFSAIGDAELLYCYENAQGLIFASFAEGFGLPLVEAMRLKLRVVCSDIPVFKEVGGDYPQYFSLDNPSNLIEILDSKWKLPDTVRPWPNWDASVKEFVNLI